MPRLRSWADWYRAYPMSEADIDENLTAILRNIKTKGLTINQLNEEMHLHRFQLRVRESRQQNSA